MKVLLGLLALIALLPISLSATTWDEPWMEEVISNAESFVRVKVVSSRFKEVRAKVTKHLAGTKKPNEIQTQVVAIQLRLSDHWCALSRS